MKHLLMGVETEYAVAAVGTPDGPLELSPDDLCRELMKQLVQSEVHLPDGTSAGVFLSNGGRLYIDHGAHPEFGTPECSNPWETLRFVRAGDRLMESLMHQVAEGNPDLPQLVLLRSNVDYSGYGTGWGCHESYLHTTSSERIRSGLIPHLVSRVIYGGAGGFNPLRPGLEFTLSPRAWLLKKTISPASTHSRGIFHVKDEPHTGPPYHRLHVLCGESTCSDVATVLKVGTTALILELINQGSRLGNSLSLARPLRALHTISGDPSCTARVDMVRGSPMTAIEIQRHYLRRVEQAQAKGRLPEWAAPLCRMWRRILDLLERGPDSVSSVLDWAIKWSLYREWLDSRATEERISSWSNALHAVCRESDDAEAGDAHQLRFEFLRERLRHGDVLRVDRERPITVPESPPPGWSADEHQRLRALRQETLEADLRFGELGGTGLFRRLEQEGLVDHKLVEDSEIEAARTAGPSSGRGRVRGALVRRHGGRGVAGEHRHYTCDWRNVLMASSGKHVDLSDPFTRAARWRTRRVAPST